jgi:hypothetical protein
LVDLEAELVEDARADEGQAAGDTGEELLYLLLDGLYFLVALKEEESIGDEVERL